MLINDFLNIVCLLFNLTNSLVISYIPRIVTPITAVMLASIFVIIFFFSLKIAIESIVIRIVDVWLIGYIILTSPPLWYALNMDTAAAAYIMLIINNKIADPFEVIIESALNIFVGNIIAVNNPGSKKAKLKNDGTSFDPIVYASLANAIPKNMAASKAYKSPFESLENFSLYCNINIAIIIKTVPTILSRFIVSPKKTFEANNDQMLPLLNNIATFDALVYLKAFAIKIPPKQYKKDINIMFGQNSI